MSPPVQSQSYSHLVLYSYIMLTKGLFVSSIGVLIPFLSLSQHNPPTYYSFLFLSRTLGSILGFFLFHHLQSLPSIPKQHHIMSSSGMVMFMFMWIFMWCKEAIGQSICICGLGMAHYCCFTSTSIVLIDAAGDKAGKWTPVVYGFFGVGALICPLIFSVTALSTYHYISWLYLGYSAVCLYLPTPNHQKLQNNQEKNEKEKQNDNSNREIQKTSTIQGHSRLEIVMCLAMFFNIGAVLTVPSWLPSYALMQHISTQQDAAFYATLFWTNSTAFKFIIATWSAPPSLKMHRSYQFTLSIATLCLLLLIFKHYTALLFVASIGFGIGFSSTFPLLMSLGSQFGVKFNSKQMANITLSNHLSFGFLTGITGYLMKYNPDLLLVNMWIINVALFFLFKALVNTMKANSNQEKMEPIEMLEIRERLLSQSC